MIIEIHNKKCIKTILSDKTFFLLKKIRALPAYYPSPFQGYNSPDKDY